MSVFKAFCMLPGLWLAACAVMPLESEQTILEGRRFSDSDLRFVSATLTTRAEIASRLGPATTWLPAQGVLVYGLRKTAGGQYAWFIAAPSGAAAAGTVQGEEREGIFFALDDRDIVTHWGRAQVKRGTTWLGAALEWSQAAGFALPGPRTAFVESPPTSAGQGTVYFYRPRDDQYYLPLLPPARQLPTGVADFVNIFLDGSLVAQLRCKSYVAVKVAPGELVFVLSADTDDVSNPGLYHDTDIRLSMAPMGSSFIEVRVEAGKGSIAPVTGNRSRNEAIGIIATLPESW
jgi:hypothetical protein